MQVRRWLCAVYPESNNTSLPILGAAMSFNKTITLSRIENIASGVIFGSPEDWLIAAANKWLIWSERAQLTTTILAISSSILLGSYAYMRVNPGFRSRNAVEQIILVMMMF